MKMLVQPSQEGLKPGQGGPAARDTVPIQRYVEFTNKEDEARHQVRPNFKGLPRVDSCKLSDDGTALVLNEAHWFYATRTLVKNSIEQLAAMHSGLTLEPNSQEQVVYTGNLAPSGEPLFRVEPRRSPEYEGQTGIHMHKVEKGTPGFDTHGVETVCLAFPNSCRMTARAILMGNPLATTRAVYRTGTGEALTGAHGASEKDTEWPRFPAEIRRGLMTYLLEFASVPTEEARRIAGLQGESLDQELARLYLGLEEEKKRVFDELAGINTDADAHIGQAWIGVSDVDLLTQEQREAFPASSPRAHWAAVVAEPGSDRVTLEGTRLSAIGGALAPVHNRLWNFNLYGTRKDKPTQLFHARWGGKQKTSIVVRGTGEAAPEGVLDFRAERERREKAQQVGHLRAQITPQMISEVREIMGEGSTVSDDDIRDALAQTDLNTISAALRLMG